MNIAFVSLEEGKLYQWVTEALHSLSALNSTLDYVARVEAFYAESIFTSAHNVNKGKQAEHYHWIRLIQLKCHHPHD